VKAFSRDLKRVRWPLNFKPSRIDKYDGSTNPAEWLEVYRLTIEAAGGDSYIMANDLPVCLLALARTWLQGLPMGSACSWSHFCRQFISNFRATCAWSGVEWDLASMVQKVRDSSLICNFTMKDPSTSEEMLSIANKYALAEEATLNTREKKKDKEPGPSDQPISSKSCDKKRKMDRSVNNAERLRHNKEYRPRPGEFEGFLDWIYIFHP
jgi:hypothetical protein